MVLHGFGKDSTTIDMVPIIQNKEVWKRIE